jgi:hypothetical protein
MEQCKKKIVKSHFENVDEDWYEVEEDFIRNLIKSFHKIVEDEKNTTGTESRLLQSYCSKFKAFYENENIAKKVKKIYSCNALLKKIKLKEKYLKIQAKSTMLVLAREEGEILEEEVEQRMVR